jgi:hypothetical protein
MLCWGLGEDYFHFIGVLVNPPFAAGKDFNDGVFLVIIIVVVVVVIITSISTIVRSTGIFLVVSFWAHVATDPALSSLLTFCRQGGLILFDKLRYE